MNNYDFMAKLKLYKYYDEPIGNYNIVSTVLFRLEDNYKSMSNYYQKIMKLVDNFYDFFPRTFYLRIYFDNSIVIKSGNKLIDDEIDNVWIKLLKKLKKYKFIQLCRFKHLEFYKKPFHKGIFGTIIRFLPIFDYKFNNNIINAIISDVDINFTLLNYLKNGYKYALKHNLKLMFKTSFCKYIFGHHYVTIDMINTWVRILAGTIIVNNYKFDIDILNNFFKQIITKDYSSDMLKFIEMDNFILYKNKTPSEKIFKYGFDEFFAMYMLNDIIDKNIKFGYIATKDLDAPIYFYYRKNNNFISDDPNKLIIYGDVLKKILGEYYDDKKSLQDNYIYYENQISVIYENKKLTDHQLKIANQTFDFYQYVKDNNLYEHYGFGINDIKCGLFQKNKYQLTKYSNEYFVFDKNRILV